MKQARKRVFRWPDYIICDGREIQCTGKFPSYAQYLLPNAYMNRTIYLGRDQWLAHLKRTGGNVGAK